MRFTVSCLKEREGSDHGLPGGAVDHPCLHRQSLSRHERLANPQLFQDLEVIL
jgi:hypothetical protein